MFVSSCRYNMFNVIPARELQNRHSCIFPNETVPVMFVVGDWYETFFETITTYTFTYWTVLIRCSYILGQQILRIRSTPRLAIHVVLLVPVFEREARVQYSYSSCYIERELYEIKWVDFEHNEVREVRDIIEILALRTRTPRTRHIPRLCGLHVSLKYLSCMDGPVRRIPWL